MSIECDRWEWLQAIHSEYGPESHTERTVLTVIFCHTNARRKTAWPGQLEIAKRARISTRQARRLLAKLEFEGWLGVSQEKGEGRAWRVTMYSPNLPSKIAARRADIQMSSPQDGKVRTFRARGADISERGADMVNEKIVANQADAKPTHNSELIIRTHNQKTPTQSDRIVVNDIVRTGMEWDESIALAKAIGFREPYPKETSKAYMQAAKTERDFPKIAKPENVRKVRRRVAMIAGQMRLVERT